ncbi:MAG: hypothetical protein CK532_03400 [Flavobacteriales bacterium]|nr:hypothetical protein [Flavobacteriaceae bacterium]PHX92381.1 MAG: hypothetical protein CK532_03400 [Flavobacteriales bacterium]
MDEVSLWTNELPSKETPEMIQGVVSQIEKDFLMAKFVFSHGLHNSLESLLPEITLCIESLRFDQPDLWMKIVNRVDLSEKQYRFVQKMGGPSSENMAKAVVLREFQKVYSRSQYT